jgi:hypothetical protein
MPSSSEPIAPGKSLQVPRFRNGLEHWNRKLHFYAGLFLLFFMWLFAFSGLVLNHPSWSFTESWKNRKQTHYEREITIPGPEVEGDIGQAREIQRQLGITGEILLTTTRTETNQFDFQIRRPGHYFFIKADWARKRASVQQGDVNLWGVMKALHTFMGIQVENTPLRRDWALTVVWAYSMDAVAAGLIFMVLSSGYMWFKLPRKRLPGALVLGLGSLACGLFGVGLRWLF